MGEFTTLGYTIAHIAQDYLYIQKNAMLYVVMTIWYSLAFVSVSDADLTLVYCFVIERHPLRSRQTDQAKRCFYPSSGVRVQISGSIHSVWRLQSTFSTICCCDGTSQQEIKN